MWYLSIWLRGARAVAVAHRAGPDAPRDPADHGVLGVHPVAEEEAEVGREVVDRHAAGEVVLDDREPVRERERELGDRVRPGLGDVVAADRDAVEVPHAVGDEVLLHVAHRAQREVGREDARVLGLVLLEDVGLHRAADARERLGPDPLVGLAVDDLVAGDAEQTRARARRGPRAATRGSAGREPSGNIASTRRSVASHSPIARRCFSTC